MEIQVNLKSLGKRRQSVKPVPYEISGQPSSVRELILAVVEAGVREYNRGLESSELLKAQENAIQCFEDGIYRIFLDEEPLENLDDKIHITKDSVFTFVRLTMLAGRMW